MNFQWNGVMSTPAQTPCTYVAPEGVGGIGHFFLAGLALFFGGMRDLPYFLAGWRDTTFGIAFWRDPLFGDGGIGSPPSGPAPVSRFSAVLFLFGRCPKLKPIFLSLQVKNFRISILLRFKSLNTNK